MCKDKSRAVAVVDDDAAVLDSTKFLLEIAGYRVSTYGLATEFLEEHEQQSACCIILDHHMPKMTGLELAARLRSVGCRTPVLLLSAALSPAIIARAHEVGIELVCEKPMNEDALLSFVSTHCQNEGLGC